MKNYRFRIPNRLIVLCGLIMLVAPIIGAPNTALATYNCTNPHCYAEHRWYGGNYGADTYISIVSLYDNNHNLGDHVTNEMWVGDDGNYCSTTIACWVEAGYEAQNGNFFYFYAYQTVNGTYYQATLGYVPYGDLGHNAYVWIHYNGYTFDVEVSTISNTYYANAPMFMNINRIDIGEELAGTATASAPTAYWNDNRWIDSGGSYHYQYRDGDCDCISNPPYGGWTIKPSNSSTGGEWNAHYP